MLQLALTNAEATLEVFNPRIEKNGPDDVPATTLKVSVNRSPDVLAFFEPTLKTMLFNESGPRDLADGIPVRDSHLKFPLGRDEEMTGVTVTIEYGVGEPMKLTDCTLKDFRITPMNGGVVILVFNINCKPDAWKDVPRFYLGMGQALTLTVTPAELPKMKDAA